MLEIDLKNIDEGVLLSDLCAKHPLTAQNIPIYVTSYVRDDAIMGVPAHCDKDLAFAQKNKI